jgi:hypothetical protein
MASLLGELERQLRSISHSEDAIQAVQAFSNGLVAELSLVKLVLKDITSGSF